MQKKSRSLQRELSARVRKLIELDEFITPADYLKSVDKIALRVPLNQRVTAALSHRESLVRSVVTLVVHADGLVCSDEVAETLQSLRELVGFPRLEES